MTHSGESSQFWRPLGLGWVDFCLLPISHKPKQNWADSGTAEVQVNLTVKGTRFRRVPSGTHLVGFIYLEFYLVFSPLETLICFADVILENLVILTSLGSWMFRNLVTQHPSSFTGLTTRRRGVVSAKSCYQNLKSESALCRRPCLVMLVGFFECLKGRIVDGAVNRQQILTARWITSVSIILKLLLHVIRI